jgi:hypothetical protein
LTTSNDGDAGVQYIHYLGDFNDKFGWYSQKQIGRIGDEQ